MDSDDVPETIRMIQRCARHQRGEPTIEPPVSGSRRDELPPSLDYLPPADQGLAVWA